MALAEHATVMYCVRPDLASGIPKPRMRCTAVHASPDLVSLWATAEYWWDLEELDKGPIINEYGA
jgi:hypothetical protein